MSRKANVLGLTVGRNSIAAVEARALDEGVKIVRTAEFDFPDGVGLEDAKALGETLREFLRAHGFSASRCVIGLTSAYLLYRSEALPPATDNTVSEVLSLRIERDFPGQAEKMVFDYDRRSEAGADAPALVVGASRLTVSQLTEMANAARLRVDAVTSASLALASSVKAAGRGYAIVHLFADGAELVDVDDAVPRFVRRLMVPALKGGRQRATPPNDYVAEVLTEMKRVLAMGPHVNGDSPRDAAILVWDDTGLDWSIKDELETCTARQVTVRRQQEMEAGGAPFASAAALAGAAAKRRTPSIDLLHSRLGRTDKPTIGRKIACTIAVVGALLAALAFLIMDRNATSRQIGELRESLNVLSADLHQAKSIIAKAEFARPWYEDRVSFLEWMRETVIAFPEEGAVWATSLAIQDDRRIALSGKATSETAVLDVLDALKSNPAVETVRPIYIRQAGRESRDVAFAINVVMTGPVGK
jgi:hypothetical protein